MTLFDVGSLLVDEGVRQYPTGMDVSWRKAERKGGGGAVNEHRSRRMLWSVIVLLRGLTNSFPSLASAELTYNRSAAPDLNVRSRRKKQHRDMEGVFEEGRNSVTIKMSVKSL